MANEQKAAIFKSVAVRPRVYESVVAQVRDAIYRGELLPGDRLPSERDLMAQLNVSRATIREALRVLESQRLIQTQPGSSGGPEVQEFSAAGLFDAMASVVQFERVSPSKVIEFRLIIDVSVCRLAAVRRNDEQLQRIWKTHSVLDAAIGGDVTLFRELDASFHDEILHAADSPLLRFCSEAIREIVKAISKRRLVESNDVMERMRNIVERHRLLATAIEAGNSELAGERARRDIVESYPEYISTDANALWGHR